MSNPVTAVQICEVGPRDGLQNLKRPFSVSERVSLIENLAGSGLRHIEAVSFVNPDRVPQMASAEEVLRQLDVSDEIRLAGLVLNRRGLERALDTRLAEIRCVVVASETFSRRNQGMGVEETLRSFEGYAQVLASRSKTLTGVVAASFGCPFEGVVAKERVVEIVARLVELGASEIILADTIGVGVPSQVSELAAACRPVIGTRPLGFHFHNTRNTGYANAYAACLSGASILDSSISGLGGCPFAPNATGNIATEDLCYMLEKMGVQDLPRFEGMLAVVDWLTERVPGDVNGHLRKAGYWP